jgi:hypothetical protein
VHLGDFDYCDDPALFHLQIDYVLGEQFPMIGRFLALIDRMSFLMPRRDWEPRYCEMERLRASSLHTLHGTRTGHVCSDFMVNLSCLIL